MDQSNVTDVDGDLEEVVAGGDLDEHALTETRQTPGLTFGYLTDNRIPPAPDYPVGVAEPDALSSNGYDNSGMFSNGHDTAQAEELSASLLLDEAGPAGPQARADGSVTSEMSQPADLVGAVRRPSTRERRAAKRLRARKVRRLIRHIDPWTVLKVSFLFYLCVFTVCAIAGVLLWKAAVESGTVSGTEDFIKDLFAFETFRFDADQIFRSSVIGGFVAVLGATSMTVLLAVLFNLISDLVGGIRLTVIEEETARPRRPLS